MSELNEIKKVLRKYDDKRIRTMAKNHDVDPDDYSRAGLIDELAERMTAPKPEPEPEPEPVKPKKKSPKKQPKPKKSKKEPDPPPPPPEPEKPKRKKKEKAPEPAPTPEPAKEEGPKHFTGGKISERNPGVCLFVVELCRGASKAKPITRDQIIAALVKQFPDRDATKLANKARVCKSWMKTHYGMDLSDRRTPDGTGYWLEEEQYQKGVAFIATKKANRKPRGRKKKDEATSEDEAG